MLLVVRVSLTTEQQWARVGVVEIPEIPVDSLGHFRCLASSAPTDTG